MKQPNRDDIIGLVVVIALIQHTNGTTDILAWKAQEGDGKPENPYDTVKAQAYLDKKWPNEGKVVLDCEIVYISNNPAYLMNSVFRGG